MLIKVCRNGGERQGVRVDDNSTVLALKRAISRQEKVPITEQTLTFDGLILEDGKSLSEYGLFDNFRVTLFLRLGFKPTFPVIISFPAKRRLRLEVLAD